MVHLNRDTVLITRSVPGLPNQVENEEADAKDGAWGARCCGPQNGPGETKLAGEKALRGVEAGLCRKLA